MKPVCPCCGTNEPEAYICPPEVGQLIDAEYVQEQLLEHHRWGETASEHSNYPEDGRPELVQRFPAWVLLICPTCRDRVVEEKGIHPWLLAVTSCRNELLTDEDGKVVAFSR